MHVTAEPTPAQVYDASEAVADILARVECPVP